MGEEAGKENTLPEGSVLNGKYRICRLIGTGGFGRTYLAEDQLLAIPVAVKELTNPAEKGIRQFLEEARLMARFTQDLGMVNVRDFFEANGTAYLVMEYLDGEDLKDYIGEHGPMEADRILEMLRPVMGALSLIHREGYIHRDVSPDNIRMTGDGRLKLLDFGAAREVTDEEGTVTVMQKRGYTPEEQYRARVYQGPWTDVYALCAVIYYCVTGRTPVDCIQRLFFDDLKRPSELGAAISPRQEEALMKGLALRKENRWQSVEELWAAFFGEEMDGKSGDEESFRGQNQAKREENGWEAQPDAAPEPRPQVAPEPERKEEQEADWAAGPKREPESASSADLKSEPKKEKEKGKKKHSHGKWLLLPILAASLLAVAVLLFLLTWRSNPYQNPEAEKYSYISQQTVTEKDIDKIRRDSGCTDLSLMSCEISDAVIQKLAEVPQIESLRISLCTGFTTLSPLAGMTGLRTLEFSGKMGEVLDGETMFPVDFPQLTSLSFYGFDRMEGSDFLIHFPALTVLHGDLEGYDSLEFFAGMPDLETVYITDVDLSGLDPSPMAGCPKIKNLYLSGTGIGDISMVSHMPSLSFAEFDGCGIRDISSLKDCPELFHLILSDNAVEDASALAGKEKLNTLDLSANQIQDITFLENLGTLTSLDLSENQIADASPLAGCTGLISLDLTGNRIGDVSPLAACDKLQFLRLADNELTGLAGCETMIRLEKVYASGNRLENVDALKNSTSIHVLNLQNNRLTELAALDNYTELETLDIRNNQIRDLSPLANCGKLKYFLADDNQIDSLKPLAGAAELTLVFADNNQLTSLEGLEEKGQLQAVTAYNNRLENLSALASSPEVFYLDFGRNQIRDLSPLKEMSGSRKGAILLEHNQISDISPLPVRQGNYLLTLYGNPVESLAPILETESASHMFDRVYLPYVKGADYQALADLGYRGRLYMVEVPLEEQAAVLREAKGEGWIGNPISFASEEEADQAAEAHRQEQRKNLMNSIQN